MTAIRIRNLTLDLAWFGSKTIFFIVFSKRRQVLLQYDTLPVEPSLAPFLFSKTVMEVPTFVVLPQ